VQRERHEREMQIERKKINLEMLKISQTRLLPEGQRQKKARNIKYITNRSSIEVTSDGVFYDTISRRLVKKPKISAFSIGEIDLNFDGQSVRNKGNFFTSDPAAAKRSFEDNFAIHDVEAR